VSLRLQRVVGWARQALLTGGAVLGAVCLLAAVAAALFGLRPLVFLSGSMSPTIETGALGISHEVSASSLRSGDVVSVPTEGGERVTHRIVAVAMDGDEAELTLRGDANATPDADTYRVTHADRVLFDVPLVGYAIGWMVGPLGLFLLGLYAAFLLSVVLKGSPDRGGHPREPVARDDAGGPQRSRGANLTGAALSLVALGAVVLPVVAPLRISPTLAAFTDPVAVSGTRFTVGVTAPTNVTCAKGQGQRVTLSWAAVSGMSYRVYDAGALLATVSAPTSTFTTENKDAGELWVVATTTVSGQQLTSADSVHFAYNGKACAAV
jgi:signal peptidase I